MADSPFIGPTYPTQRSRTRSLNLMPVRVEVGNERTQWTFKDAYGLRDVSPVNPPTYYTSWPYPLLVAEALDFASAIPTGGRLMYPIDDALDFAVTLPLSGTLAAVLNTYTFQPPDELDFLATIPLSGSFPGTLRSYSQPADELDFANAIPTAGSFPASLVPYSQPADALDFVNAVPLSGTLV